MPEDTYPWKSHINLFIWKDGVLLKVVILGAEKLTHWCHEHKERTEGKSF